MGPENLLTIITMENMALSDVHVILVSALLGIWATYLEGRYRTGDKNTS